MEPTANPSTRLPPARLAELYPHRNGLTPLPRSTEPQPAGKTTELSPLQQLNWNVASAISPETSRAAKARQELEKTRRLIQTCPSIRHLRRLTVATRTPEKSNGALKRKYPEDNQTPEQSTASPSEKRRRLIATYQTPESTVERSTEQLSISPTVIPQPWPLFATPCHNPCQPPPTCQDFIADSAENDTRDSNSNHKLDIQIPLSPQLSALIGEEKPLTPCLDSEKDPTHNDIQDSRVNAKLVKQITSCSQQSELIRAEEPRTTVFDLEQGFTSSDIQDVRLNPELVSQTTACAQESHLISEEAKPPTAFFNLTRDVTRNDLDDASSNLKLDKTINPLEPVQYLETTASPIPDHPKPPKNRVKLKIRNSTRRELPYLRRNWIGIEGHQRKPKIHQFSLYEVKIEINDNNDVRSKIKENKRCCGLSLDPDDIIKIKNEISIIQTCYQLFFLAINDNCKQLSPKFQSSPFSPDNDDNNSKTNHPALNFLWQRLKFWKPIDNYLSSKFVAEVTIPNITHELHKSCEIKIKISFYHRSCLRSSLMDRLFQLNNPPQWEEEKDQRNGTTTQVVESNQYDLEPSDYINTQSCRNKREPVKVPPRVGALHFQTMEPYHEGDLVYDSDGEVSYAAERDWRLFRESQPCERTTHLSIIKKPNPPSTHHISKNNLISEIRQLWNEYLNKILVPHTSNNSANFVIDEFMMKNFIENFYFPRFKSNPYARSELIKFMLCFDFFDCNTYTHFTDFLLNSLNSAPSFSSDKILYLRSFIQYFDSLNQQYVD